jgi:hypothetical protein
MEVNCNNKLKIVSEDAFGQPKSKGVNRCSTVVDDDIDNFTQYSTLVLRHFTSSFLFALTGKVSFVGKYAYLNDSSFSIQSLCMDILCSVSRPNVRSL